MPFYPDWLVALDDVANGKEGATITSRDAHNIIRELRALKTEVTRLRERPRGMQIGDGNTQTNRF